MIDLRTIPLYVISLTSMIESFLLLIIIFMPNSLLLPESSLLTELQEIGPFLLNSVLPKNLDSMVFDKEYVVNLDDPQNLLLVSISRYVGILGFSREIFFEAMFSIWSGIMVAFMFLSIVQFSLSFLILLYLIMPRKYPKLLLPWISFNILLMIIVFTATSALIVAIMIPLIRVQVQGVHYYTIAFLGVYLFMIMLKILLLVVEFVKGQREVNMMSQCMKDKVIVSMTLLNDRISEFKVNKRAEHWNSSSSSSSSSSLSSSSSSIACSLCISGHASPMSSESSPPPSYSQVVKNPFYASESFDDAQDIIPKAPVYYSLPESSYLHQSPAAGVSESPMNQEEPLSLC